ncbi:hypothetical protein D9M68_915810 [compost metagenome]
MRHLDLGQPQLGAVIRQFLGAELTLPATAFGFVICLHGSTGRSRSRGCFLQPLDHTDQGLDLALECCDLRAMVGRHLSQRSELIFELLTGHSGDF